MEQSIGSRIKALYKTVDKELYTIIDGQRKLLTDVLDHIYEVDDYNIHTCYSGFTANSDYTSEIIVIINRYNHKIYSKEIGNLVTSRIERAFKDQDIPTKGLHSLCKLKIIMKK